MYGYHAIPTVILIRDLDIGKLVVPNTKGDKSNLYLSKKERKVSRINMFFLTNEYSIVIHTRYNFNKLIDYCV